MNQDVPQPEHSELMNWLNAKYQERVTKLSDTKAFVSDFQDLYEAKALIARLQKSVNYYIDVRLLIEREFEPEPSKTEQSEDEESEDEESEDEKSEDGEFEDEESEDEEFEDEEESVQRDPKEMLRPEFRRMTMFEIIESILNKQARPISNEEAAKIAYDTQTLEDFERARGSISAQLRIGAQQGRWVKLQRGLFAANNLVPKSLGGNGN